MLFQNLDKVLGLYYFLLNIGCKSGNLLLDKHILKISSNFFFQKSQKNHNLPQKNHWVACKFHAKLARMLIL